MNLPIISIIVPIYNPPCEMFRQCIHSVQEAMALVPTGFVECVFVNDGSTESYVDEILKTLDGSFRYIKIDNEGVSAARNIGMEQALGTYLMFVDADDWIELNALQYCLKIIDESQADVIYMRHVNGGHRPEKPQWQEFIEGEEGIRQFIIEMTAGNAEASNHGINTYSVSAKLYRKELIESCQQQFDPQMIVAEDFLFNLHVLASPYCKSLYFSNKLVYHYVYNNKSVTRSYSNLRLRTTLLTLSRLEDYLYSCMDGSTKFEKAIHYQLLKSIEICMRTYFVHPLNKMSVSRKFQELHKYLSEPIIQRWIKKLTWNDGANWKKRRDICLLRLHLYWILLLTEPTKRRFVSQKMRFMRNLGKKQ